MYQYFTYLYNKRAQSVLSESSLGSRDACRPLFLALNWFVCWFHSFPQVCFLCSARRMNARILPSVLWPLFGCLQKVRPLTLIFQQWCIPFIILCWVTWALHFEGAGKNSSFYNKYGTYDRDFRFIRKLQIIWIYALQFWSLGKRPEMQTFVIFMDTSNFLPINYVSGYLHMHTTRRVLFTHK